MLRNHERYRLSPFPDRPLSLDPWTVGGRDIDAALQHARDAVHGRERDYFSDEYARYGAGPNSAPPRVYDARPLTPLQLDRAVRYDRESHGSGVDELVRRTNLAVSLANLNTNPRHHFSQVHPMMCSDGRFPADFRAPKTLESVKLLDNTQLDRILQGYKLPYDSRAVLSGLRYVAEPVTSTRLRQAKLSLLFEYLGAVRIAEQDRMKHGFV